MMKLPHFLELLCFLVMGNVTRAGIDPSRRNSTETVPNLDAIEAGKGLISILDNSTFKLDNSSSTFSHMNNATLDEDNTDVKCMLRWHLFLPTIYIGLNYVDYRNGI